MRVVETWTFGLLRSSRRTLILERYERLAVALS